MISNDKPNLFGLPPARLTEILAGMGEPSFRARQILSWIYRQRATDFAAMTDLPKALRERLTEGFALTSLTRFRRYLSSDGSVKYIFDLGRGQEVEAVYMPMEKGVTLCLSSQVGCAQACSFCLTAQMGFIRNLTPAEIVGQVYAIMLDRNLEMPCNIVMMGMGEPLLNVQNLVHALDLFIGEHGFGLSPRRITVSTSGHVRNLLKLGSYPRLPRIAVSLNATTDRLRDTLMPVNRKWKIQELIEACRSLPIPPRERITFEYVLIKDVNDAAADAKRLVRLLAGLRCKVNLIPFNETPELPYRQSEPETIEAFRLILNRSGLRNTVRWSKGRDIGAACGQLATPVAARGPDLLRVGAIRSAV